MVDRNLNQSVRLQISLPILLSNSLIASHFVVYILVVNVICGLVLGVVVLHGGFFAKISGCLSSAGILVYRALGV